MRGLNGGGKFASFLLLTGNDGITFALVGLLLQVVPFFMIPSLVRGSLAVAGNIGTKIAGFGQKLGSMAGRESLVPRLRRMLSVVLPCMTTNVRRLPSRMVVAFVTVLLVDSIESV